MKYKIYVIKHWWDESDYGTKVRPKWITAKKVKNTELDKEEREPNKEEKKIKNIAKVVLEEYNDLVEKKPAMKKINGFFVYYCYLKEKNDPDPSNSRRVTDMIFYISPRPLVNPCFLQIPDNYILEKTDSKSIFAYLALGLIFLFAIISLYKFSHSEPKNNSSADPIVSQNLENTQDRKSPDSAIGRTKTLSKYKQFCNENKNDIAKEIKSLEYCYQHYLKEICENDIEKSWSSWLEEHKKSAKSEKVCRFIKDAKKADGVNNHLKNDEIKIFILSE